MMGMGLTEALTVYQASSWLLEIKRNTSKNLRDKYYQSHFIDEKLSLDKVSELDKVKWLQV